MLWIENPYLKESLKNMVKFLWVEWEINQNIKSKIILTWGIMGKLVVPNVLNFNKDQHWRRENEAEVCLETLCKPRTLKQLHPCIRKIGKTQDTCHKKESSALSWIEKINISVPNTLPHICFHFHRDGIGIPQLRNKIYPELRVLLEKEIAVI